MENKDIHKELENNEYVRSYNINYYDNGIVTLTINTHKRWIPYSYSSSSSFGFDNVDNYELYIKELDIPKYYTHFHMQNKDQIIHLFLPSEMIMKGTLSNKIKKYRKTGIDLKQ